MTSPVVITVAPSSVTAPLNTFASISCGGTGDGLSWTVGGHSLTDSIKQYREISVTTNNISVDVWSSVLTIRALPINDGITVQCTIFSVNPFDLKHSGAILTIEGKIIILII